MHPYPASSCPELLHLTLQLVRSLQIVTTDCNIFRVKLLGDYVCSFLKAAVITSVLMHTAPHLAAPGHHLAAPD